MISIHILGGLKAKSRKYRGMFEEHSPEKLRQARKKDWSQQEEHMQVPKGRDQVSGGVSVPCWHSTPMYTPFQPPLCQPHVCIYLYNGSYPLPTPSPVDKITKTLWRNHFNHIFNEFLNFWQMFGMNL